jgi:uncharacterized protein YkwD
MKSIIMPALAMVLAACATELEPTAPLGGFPGPQPTGNFASDVLNWISYRRWQAGVGVVARNSNVDVAAQGHANYQRDNATVTLEQEPGRPGFSGRSTADRLSSAGYQSAPGRLLYSEVVGSARIAAFATVDSAMASFPDRAGILEPVFTEIGVGAAASGGVTYWVATLTANLARHSLPAGQVAVWPYANQTDIPAATYPISVHATRSDDLQIQRFTLTPRGRAAVATRLISRATDPFAPGSAAAIVPQSALEAATTYDVSFAGTVNGTAVTRTWSFTTR